MKVDTHRDNGTGNRKGRRTSLILLMLWAIATGLGLWPTVTEVRAASNPPIGLPQFQRLWDYADRAVSEGKVGRSWVWGPTVSPVLTEPYTEGGGGNRAVQYFDKTRMEQTGSRSVSNGLLAKEMIGGLLQLGDTSFRQYPSNQAVNIAGDQTPNLPNPTYASFRPVSTINPGENRATDQTGQSVTATLNREGNPGNRPELGSTYGVKNAYFEPSLGHNIPDVFWTFLNGSGLVYRDGSYVTDRVFDWLGTMGLPLSEAYWTRSVVGGQPTDVLVQAFERRVLTYTPANGGAFRVEMGNVGQHYYQWRYVQLPAYNTVEPERLANLTRGVNLTRWFWNDDGSLPSADHLQTYITAPTLASIKQAGFRHVRLVVHPALLFQESNPAQPNPAVLPYLDHALDLITANGLAVILDMHFYQETDPFKARLVNEAGFADKYARFWQALAQHLNGRDPRLLFLEVLNEPSQPDESRWYSVQAQILVAMRVGAPAHTLIADSNNRVGNRTSEPDALLQMRPVQDPNVVYNFHFYEPGVFTNQGAAFIPGMKDVTGLPYPYQAQACQAAVARLPEYARSTGQYYCNQQLDKAKLDARIKQAADWATRYGVHLTVNEFGAYYYGIDKTSRLNWLRDVRSLFEKYGIGWSIWGYDDAYGLQHDENGHKVFDQDAVQALLQN